MSAPFSLDDLLQTGSPQAGGVAVPPAPAGPPPPPVNDVFGFPPQQQPLPQGYPVGHVQAPYPSPGVAPPPGYPPVAQPQASYAPALAVAPTAQASYPQHTAGLQPQQHPVAQPVPAAPPATDPFVPQVPGYTPAAPIPPAGVYAAAPHSAVPQPTSSVHPYAVPPPATTAPMPTAAAYQTVPSVSPGYAPAPVAMTPAVAPSAAPVAGGYDGGSLEADQRHLEQIRHLRMELEREQQREEEKRAERDTWPCAQCTYRSPLGVTVCEMCDTVRPGHSRPAQPSRPAPAPQPVAPTPVAPPAVPSDMWACETCTLHNSRSTATCTACGSHGPPGTGVSQQAQQQPVSAVQQQQMMLLQSAQGGGVGPSQRVTIVDPPRAATWTCSECTFDNKPNARSCDMCGSPNPNAPAAPPQRPSSGRRQGGGGYPGASSHHREYNSSPPASPEDPGVVWQKDKDATECNKCHSAFGVMNRRHHCRKCGFVYCARCTRNTLKIKGTDQRACINCYRENASLTGY